MKLLGLFLLLAFLLISCSQSTEDSKLNSQYFKSVYEDVIQLSKSNVDSTLKLANEGLRLATSNSDTAKAYMYTALGIAYKELGNLDSAFTCYERASLIGRRLANKELLSSIYNNKALAFKVADHLDSAKIYYRKSLTMRLDLKDTAGSARCLINMANLQKGIASPDSAILYALEALSLQRQGKQFKDLGNTWIAIGNIYIFLSQKEKAIRAYQNALRIFSRNQEVRLLGIAQFNIGNFWIQNSEENHFLDSAELYYKAAKESFYKSKTDLYYGFSLDAIGTVHLNKRRYRKAIYTFNEARNVYLKNRDTEGVITTDMHLFDAYSTLGLIDSATKFILRAKRLCLKTKNYNYLPDAYDLLSSHLLDQHKYDSSIFYLRKFHQLEDSIKSERVQYKISQSEERFENLRLRNESISKDLRIQKQKTKNQTVFVSILTLLIISILITLIFRQRLKARTALAAKNQELHLQKLDELAKEKQLEKITALMEGQEQERKRISGELHDGLGSLLATIKHHFEVVEDKIDTNHEAYEKAYGLLDRASEEVRRISHNMASNILSKFGLVAALQDLAEMVNTSNQVQFELSISGLEGRMENSKEIHLFRICQELVSNALKHAEAKTISLQITMRDNELSLIVEDDGKGFEQEKAALAEGMGLSNLRARIDHLEGSIDIDSTLGRGTTVVIEVPA